MTIYGVSIGGTSGETIATQDGRYGFVKAIRAFQGGLPGSLPTGTTTAREIFYSFKCSKTDYTGMAAGNYDAQIKTWLKGLPAGQTVWATYYHEPENNWPSGASFAAAQDHFIHLVQSTTGVVATVKTCVIFTAYILTYGHGGSTRNPNSYWPTTYTPDMVGFDFDGVVVGSSYPTATFATWSGYAKAFAAAKGVAWGVTEYGNGVISTDTDHSGRTAMLTSNAATFAADGANYVLLWDDVDPADHNNDDHLTTSNEITAWKNLVGASISAPTGVTATSNTAGTSITMTWAANPSGDNITGWNVYLNAGFTTTLYKINSTARPLTPRSFTFNTLADGTPIAPGAKYSCAVVALNAGSPGKSGYSTIQNVTTSTPGPTNHAPIIDSATATPDAANPLQINFASTAHDPDSNPITYSWAVTYGGVTQTISTASGSLTFDPSGTGTAVLSVSDGTLVTTQTVPFAVTGLPDVTTNFGWDLSAHKPNAFTQAAPKSLLATLVDIDAQVAAAQSLTGTGTGGGGGGFALTPVNKSGTFAFAAGDLAAVDISSSSANGTLPNTPADKSLVMAYLKAFTAGQTLTITAAGSNTIRQSNGTTATTTTLTLGAGQTHLLQYDILTGVWETIAARVPVSVTDARYDAAGAATGLQGKSITSITGATTSARLAGGFTVDGTAPTGATLKNDLFVDGGNGRLKVSKTAGSPGTIVDVAQWVQDGLVATPIKLWPAAGRAFGTTATAASTPKLGLSGQRFAKGTSSTQGITWKVDLDPSWVHLKLTMVGSLVGSTGANDGQAIRWQLGTFGEAAGVLLTDFPSGTGWTSQSTTQTIASAVTATQMSFVLTTSINGWATGQDMCSIALVRLDNDAADTMTVAWDLQWLKVEPV